MEKLKLIEPCDLCANWQSVTEVCPDIADYIPDVTGFMCSQGAHGMKRYFCGLRDDTKFIPREGITQEQLKDRLSTSAIETITRGLISRNNLVGQLLVEFTR